MQPGLQSYSSGHRSPAGFPPNGWGNDRDSTTLAGLARKGLASCLFVLLASCSWQAAARPALVDNLDHATLALRMSSQSGEARLLEHGRETGRARFGGQAERVLLRTPAGHLATLVYPIPKAPAIGELHMAIWVMCSRPGVRLAARVTLPRSYNPAMSAPYQITVRGSATTQVGGWQKISLNRLPRRLARQARVARLQTDDPLDERGAYVRALVLLVPGGNQPVELLVDRVEVEGVLQPEQDESTIQQVSAASELATQQVSIMQVGSPMSAGNQLPPGRPTLPLARAEPPRVPRVIQWQGEPFETLARIDFDAIAMQRPASIQEMAKARSLGLFLVCPPPTPDKIRAGIISQDFSPVMAWDLGALATSSDLDTAMLLKELLARYDPNPQRRSVVRPIRYVHEASRIADILLLGRDTLGARLPLGDYATWLTGRKRLSRPGTPIWLQLDTDLPPGSALQRSERFPTGELATVASRQQLATQVALATTLKSQGFFFTSHTSLIAKDLDTRRRALALELTNLRIGLIEPWLASGKFITAARSNDPHLTAAVLQVERSYLLVPIRWQNMANSTRAKRRWAEEPTTFLVPGVPESCEVYFLTPAGASTLRHRRVTGGIRIFFDSRVADGFVLFTEDGRAFSRIAQYIQRQSFRTTQRTRDLASVRLQQALPRLSLRSTPSTFPIQPFIRSTQGLIEQCDTLLAQRNIEVAYQRAVAANAMLDELEMAFAPKRVAPVRLDALAPAPAATTIPPGEPAGMAVQAAGPFAAFRATGQANTARLLDESFEDLTELQQTGWRHQRLPMDGLSSAVHLSPESPYQGSYCLELAVQPTGLAPPVVATAPVWVTSAPVRVRAGERVEIRGMVRVPQAITGSVDGLKIFDSLGGKALALRYQQTGSWKPFRMVRVAPADTELTMTIALTGIGQAQVDALTVSKLPSGNLQANRRPVQRLPPAR